MTQTALPYMYDPLCGWCYAAAPLIRAAREILPVVGHGGGMLTGERRKRISPEWHDYVMPKGAQIAALTGQVFGRAYQQGLLHDHTALLDSEPPTAATLAAEQSAGRGLDFLDAVQTAHYFDGRRVADLPVLEEIAREIGLDLPEFQTAYASFQMAVVSEAMQPRPEKPPLLTLRIWRKVNRVYGVCIAGETACLPTKLAACAGLFQAV